MGQEDQSYYVYILECADGTYYTGITNHLKRRIKLHQQGKAARYTRGRLPVTLKYVEKVKNKSDALKREYQIKQMERKEKEQLIQTFVHEGMKYIVDSKEF
ncbi:GIY-YIG nuclease family protein [Thermoflavimicrobium dichotomicum]|uniref:Putative endonuclease n=1 Tax=Thermoflavimicrobium dichotomicum TaxID=46223 RepID=A0A1I3QPG2_9BACL|nr:GIY-YIG nuclease family protein [Thermoflavimicrobium dichotomicum]SFJ35007.1 putative endonuclease [Thermoflavimicrobium dichotomicum]